METCLTKVAVAVKSSCKLFFLYDTTDRWEVSCAYVKCSLLWTTEWQKIPNYLEWDWSAPIGKYRSAQYINLKGLGDSWMPNTFGPGSPQWSESHSLLFVLFFHKRRDFTLISKGKNSALPYIRSTFPWS